MSVEQELEVTEEHEELDEDQVQSALEEEARAQGWTDEASYKGKPGTWKPAKEFIEFGERLNPILKKQRDDYKKELDQVKGDLDYLRSTTKELMEARLAAQKEQHEATVTYLKSQIKAARREGDHDLEDVLQDQLDKAEKEAPKASDAPVVNAEAREQADRVKREFTEFVSQPELAWFVDAPGDGPKNKTLSRALLNVASELRQAKPRLVGKAFFAEALEILKEENPEAFEKARRTSAVESGSTSSPRNARSGSYESMPKEARAMCDRFVKNKDMTKEEYVKYYFSQKGV